MAAIDHFSIGREVCAQMSEVANLSSIAPTTPLRICLRTSSLHAACSPSHRAISFSSWTRYSTSPMISPSGLLKASVLCKACGTSPSYDPPISEWVYLGADQPAHVDGKPEIRERWSDWRQRQSPSGVQMTVPGMHMEEKPELSFAKQPIKRMSTESQLTRGIKMGSHVGDEVRLADKYGFQGLTCEELPSAFDSESDEED